MLDEISIACELVPAEDVLLDDTVTEKLSQEAKPQIMNDTIALNTTKSHSEINTS